MCWGERRRLRRGVRLCASALLCLCVCRAALGASQGAAQALPRDAARLQEIGRAVFDAVAHDDPARAEAVFFPREPFLLVKAMRDAGRYWDKLHERFATDIHTLHTSMQDPKHAQFERLVPSHRGGLVRVGEEGNKLPYRAARHNTLRYRAGKLPQSFEVRVLITWEDTFYVIHLSEFH